MPGDAPEMEPEFVRLVNEVCAGEWHGKSEAEHEAKVAALYTWHRAEVERAFANGVARGAMAKVEIATRIHNEEVPRA